MATFRGKESAWISGRGLVIFGDVIEGHVKVGDILKWPKEILANQHSKIIGIELATYSDANGRHHTQSGIVLDHEEAHSLKRPNGFCDLIVTGIDFEIIQQS